MPKGIIDAAGVLALVFMAGAAVSVVDKTGALRGGVGWLATRLARRETLIIPGAARVFAAAGAAEGMWEEIIALMPVLLVLTRGVGFDALTAVSMSLGAAGIGSSFSPMNPFGVGIAQRFAELPILSGWPFRLAVLVPAVAYLGVGHDSPCAGDRGRAVRGDLPGQVLETLTRRHGLVLATTVAAFATFMFGVIEFGWGFEEMAAVFLALGLAAGVVGGLSIAGTFAAFSEGFEYDDLRRDPHRRRPRRLRRPRRGARSWTRSSTPWSRRWRSCRSPCIAMGISVVQTLLAAAGAEQLGRVTLTLPILVPLSDLLGLSRQVTVTATQFGPGRRRQFLPTDGALMAILALAGVRFERWLKFCLPSARHPLRLLAWRPWPSPPS